MNVYDIIKRPLITEKTQNQMQGENKYSFEVDPRATKIQIAQAFEAIFGVKPEKVNIINTKSVVTGRGRKFLGKTKAIKKAIISIPKDKALNFLKDDEE